MRGILTGSALGGIWIFLMLLVYLVRTAGTAVTPEDLDNATRVALAAIASGAIGILSTLALVIWQFLETRHAQQHQTYQDIRIDRRPT